MRLDNADSQLVEGSLDAWTHVHLHLLGLGPHGELQLLGVIVWPSAVGADFEQALHILVVFRIGVVKSDPVVLHLILAFEIHRSQVNDGLPDEFVLQPALVEHTDHNVGLFRFVRFLCRKSLIRLS